MLDWRTFSWALALGLSAVCVGAAPQMSAPTVYTGMCDASAGVAIGTNLFAAADDEGNQIRIFNAETGGPPLQVVQVSSFLTLVGKFPETDLEGAAWLGDQVFWIGSHGRNREGKYRPNRHCFFATRVLQTNPPVRWAPVGICYRSLLTDLMLDARLRPFNLAAASARPPKSKGGLNIEGLCATAEGHLLIGFRNPIPDGRALIVPLLNPHEVIRGVSAKLGAPTLLDLDGLGIRDLGFWQNRIYILAGAYDSEKDFRLYVWNGAGDPIELAPGLKFRPLTPEALVFYADQPRFQVLSDDGTTKIQGIDCKRLTDPSQKRFRAAWLTP